MHANPDQPTLVIPAELPFVVRSMRSQTEHSRRQGFEDSASNREGHLLVLAPGPRHVTAVYFFT